MVVRIAERKDVSFLYDLRNEPLVRAMMWNSGVVDCDAHLVWFDSVLENPNRTLYILEAGGVPVGQVRYDADSESAEVSVSVMSKFRGKGYASEGLKKSAEVFFQKVPEVKIIFAHIKPDNSASVRVFTKAGYEMNGIVRFEGHDCVCMTLARS